jgi:hypothetical protein
VNYAFPEDINALFVVNYTFLEDIDALSEDIDVLRGDLYASHEDFVARFAILYVARGVRGIYFGKPGVFFADLSVTNENRGDIFLVLMRNAQKTH